MKRIRLEPQRWGNVTLWRARVDEWIGHWWRYRENAEREGREHLEKQR